MPAGDSVQQLSETPFRPRLITAEFPDRLSIGHAAPERLHGSAGIETLLPVRVHALSLSADNRTSPATGFTSFRSRTSSMTRVRNAE